MGCGCGSKFSGKGASSRRVVASPSVVAPSPTGRVIQSAEMRKPGGVTTPVPLKRTTV